MTLTGFRPGLQTVLLSALFVAMAMIAPEHDPSEIVLILLLGLIQVLESQIIPSEALRSKIAWNSLKLAVGWVLMGYTGGVTSSYYLVLLFPVIGAAATLGVISTLIFTALSCGVYLSFFLFVDWNRYDIHPDQIVEFTRRLLFLAISGLLANTLAEALRVQSRRYKALADELAGANRSLREAEAQVRRTERLAALGQLTAGLAHELRNPLGTIRASADMLERNLPQGDEIAKELAGYITSEVDRTNSLVSRFLDFARPLEIQRAPADLGEVIALAVSGSRLQQEEHGVGVEFHGQALRFPFDGELMERVFLNLIVNAIQASPRGSAVGVEAERRENFAIVRVIDRGSGIEPSQRESIFNPFFTTKSDGTGLGLAIVAKIVDEHGGKIEVESNPGEGSVFTVLLPLE